MADCEALVTDTLGELIEIQAKRQPERIGLIFEGREISYGEMNAQANCAAHAFRAAGLGPGDRIVWLAQNLADFWYALFGASKMGAVITPVNWRLAPVEIAQIIDDARPALVIAERAMIDQLAGVEGFSPPPVWYLEDEGDDGFTGKCARQTDAEIDHAPSLDDVALQLYTSGTTGLPKGVLLTQRCYANSGEAGAKMKLLYPQSDDEVALHALPHFHVAGVNFGAMAVARSMPIQQLRQFDPGAIVDAAQGQARYSSFFVPAMIMMILQAAREKGASLGKFVAISYGAAPMPEPLLDAAMAAMPNARWTQFYGATETTGGLTWLTHEDHEKDKPQRRSAGKAYLGTDARIVDPETGEPVATGETGEIITRSGFLMRGYWNRPDATGEVLKDGWYRTGDAGYQTEDGYIFVVDRIKDMIISGGENIYPAELENILSKHGDLAECAVIGVPDEKWGEVVKVCAAKKPGAAISEEDLKQFLCGKVASFKMPRFVEFLDALPRNPSGKILKTELRRLHAS